MARTPAYINAGRDDDGDYADLHCDICGDTIYESERNQFPNFIDMIDAHDKHAADVHGER